YLILLVALVLFVTEKLRVDLVALLVLCVLAVGQLVTPAEAFAGFSNPAVITLWAMFIVSEGLARTGIASSIGNLVLNVAGSGEVRLIAVIMTVSAGMSAFMNNIGVSALLLPVVIDVCRVTSIPPSRLLMPLAMGSLLGGLTTMVGTPPNLLVSNALASNGLEPFGLFDYSPVGVIVVIISILFFLLLGRHLLPRRSPGREISHRRGPLLQSRFAMNERTFVLRIDDDSVLDGKTIAQSRLYGVAGLKVIAVLQGDSVNLFPDRDTTVFAGQSLLVQGRLDRLRRLRSWADLIISREKPVLWELMSDDVLLLEAQIGEKSSLCGQQLDHGDFQERYKGNVLAIRQGDALHRGHLSDIELGAGDRLVIQGSDYTQKALEKSPDFDQHFEAFGTDLSERDNVGEFVFVIRVPSRSVFVAHPLRDTGIADLFDFRLLGRIRSDGLELFPDRDEIVEPEDRWLIQGNLDHMDVLRGFQGLTLIEGNHPDLDVISGDTVTLVEAMLDPHSDLAGTPVTEMQFRDKYGLELLAVWRNGRAYRTGLDQMTVMMGDALLLMGPRDKLVLLDDDEDFLVLTPVRRQVEDTSKAGRAIAVLAAFVIAILTGWLPIEVGAVMAAAAMLLTSCLNMEQAYRAIDWRSVFLIACMLPLGTALQSTDAAAYAAQQVLAVTGDLGPWVVIFSFYIMTAFATLFMPNAALVVVMAPIVLTASAEMGVSPEPGMMAIAIAASASFASPVSHPANLLVMGPGGYRFVDYLKVGIPLTILVFIVSALALP
ncbi:MAG: anion permease, partial [Gammaproteobacteria bacterium]|nr:anion permease [Gammaproteobacteria bacterium]